MSSKHLLIGSQSTVCLQSHPVILPSLEVEQNLVDLSQWTSGTTPWCLDLLSTPVQRWWWLTTGPERLPSISKPPVSPYPHHICGAEGNDPFGWLPRHFPYNALSVSLQPICCVSACVSRCLSLSATRFLFIFYLCYGICFSRSFVWEKVAALSNEETRPVTGTNYCTVVAEHSGEGGQKGCASGHYWQCTLPCCLTLSIYKSHRERKELWLNRWAVQLNFSDAAVTICLDCNGFMTRTDPDCWSWLNDDPFHLNLSLSHRSERKVRFWCYR